MKMEKKIGCVQHDCDECKAREAREAATSRETGNSDVLDAAAGVPQNQEQHHAKSEAESQALPPEGSDAGVAPRQTSVVPDVAELVKRLNEPFFHPSGYEEFMWPLPNLHNEAADAITVQQKRIKELETQVKTANADADMYAKAWQRELGQWMGRNRHRIDACVTGTRALVKAFADYDTPRCCGTPEYCGNNNCASLLKHRIALKETP
jgi:plasmid maintenance system antidote protein VapI